MSDFGQQFPPPDDPYQKKYTYDQQYGRSYEWQEVWQKAIMEPSPETYEELVADPNASFSRGLVWLIVVILVGSFISLLGQAIIGTSTLAAFGGGGDQAALFGANIICTAILIPIAIAIYLVILLIYELIVHVMAGILGGKGEFEDLFYAYSTWLAPLYLITTLIGLIPILGFLVSVVIFFYQLVLLAISTKAVYRFGWFQAIVASLMPIMLVGGLIFCCVIALVGSTGNIFDNINATLQATP